MENNNHDVHNAEFYDDKSEASDKEDCEKPGNFKPHQSKEIDKIAHQAYNNVDFEVKK